MAKFKDAEKRQWSLKITVGALKRVKDETEIDMGFVVNGELDKLKDVLSCPFSIAAVLYTLCSDQIEERELTPEEFSELLYGDTFEKAVEALIESILDFFPRQKAQVLRDALAKEKARQDKELEKALEELSKD